MRPWVAPASIATDLDAVVGGNSVLYGAGQRGQELWTRHLQARLGDGYRVLNLALPGCHPAEFGGTAAEMLARDFPRLIFVSDVLLADLWLRLPSTACRRRCRGAAGTDLRLLLLGRPRQGVASNCGGTGGGHRHVAAGVSRGGRALGSKKRGTAVDRLRTAATVDDAGLQPLQHRLALATWPCSIPQPRRWAADQLANRPQPTILAPGDLAWMMTALHSDVFQGRVLLHPVAATPTGRPTELERAYALVFPPGLRAVAATGRALVPPA